MAIVACVNVVPSLQLFPGYPAPRLLGLPSTRPSVDDLVDRVGAETEHHGSMVVIVPSRGAEDLWRDMLVVRNILGAYRVVVVRVSLPPLATAVLASQVAAVAPELTGAGQVLAGAALLQQQLIVLAWASRVDKLDYPSPSLVQHAWSLMPGTRFVIGVQPKPFVQRIRRGEPLPGVRPGGGPWLGVVAPPGNDSAWLRQVAIPQLGVERVAGVDLPPQAKRWWRSGRVAELVVCPDSPALIGRWIASARPCAPCPWCGEPVHGTRCPVCSMVLTETVTAGVAR